MGAVRELADRYITDLAAMNRMMSTYLGLPGREHDLQDLSQEGLAQEVNLAASTLAALATLTDDDLADRRCRALMEDRLGLVQAEFDAGEHLRPLSVSAGGPPGCRSSSTSCRATETTRGRPSPPASRRCRRRWPRSSGRST